MGARAKLTSRTHNTFLPGTDIRPSLQEVFHNENIGNNALIISKGEATDRGEQCTSEGVFVSQQPGDARLAITIGIRVGIGGRRPWGGKVQTPTKWNGFDAIDIPGNVTRRRVQGAMPWIFCAKRSIVFRTRIAAHSCKTERRCRKEPQRIRYSGQGSPTRCIEYQLALVADNSLRKETD
jgi:hypothetical protein